MLSIVGNNPGIETSPVFETNNEIWVMNGKGATLPRYDAVFQIHQPVDWGGGWSQRWLQENTTVPVYMRKQYSEIPMSTPYPFISVFAMIRNVKHRQQELMFSTGTPAYALALAVLMEKPEIQLIGLDMNEREYKEQAESFAFWVGFAAGRGIKVDIDCLDDIFDRPLYGEKPLSR